MRLARHRYDAASLLAQLDGQAPSRDGSEWCLRFAAGPDVDGFLAYLPPVPADWHEAIAVVRAFLAHLPRLDDDVQYECERDHARGGYRIENVMLEVAYLTVEGDTVEVEYFGTAVNTQWTAVYRRGALGEWARADA